MPRTKPAPPVDDATATDPASLGALRMIPLGDLTLSPLNARQVVDQAEVEAMAVSIATAGLLQNLVGYQDDTASIGIVGGGKRLRALQLLAAQGFMPGAGMPGIDPVPVIVTMDPHTAVAWAGTENTARSALGPADEITAYAALRARGSSADMIARTFAVPAAHVARRLALANLPDAVIAALRDGKITIDVARALTLAPTPDRAAEVCEIAIANDWRDWRVKEALTANTTGSRDRRVKFLGIEALQAAGVVVQRDLFSDDIYIAAGDLIHQLFVEKGEDLAAAKAAAESWSWSEFFAGQPYEFKADGLVPIYREENQLPDGDLERMQDLAESNGLDPAEQDELVALQARADGDFSDDQRSVGGVVISIRHNGTPDYAYFARKSAMPGSSVGGSGGASSGGKSQEPKPLPESLLTDLARIKLLSLQTALMGNASLMLDLLGWQLTAALPTYAAPLAIALTPPAIAPEKVDGTTVPEALARPKTDHRPAMESFTAWLTLPQAERIALTGLHLARLFRFSTRDPVANDLAAQLAVNPRDVWTPTAEGYFSRLPAPALDAIYAELIPADSAALKTFKALKKGPKAQNLHSLFGPQKHAERAALQLTPDDEARLDAWLPPELHWAAPGPVTHSGDGEADDPDQTAEDGDQDDETGDSHEDEAA